MNTKDALINSLVLTFIDNSNITVSELKTLLTEQMKDYSVSEITETSLITTDGTTTKELFKYFVRGKLGANKAQGTIEQYKIALSQLCSFCNKELPAITTDDINYFLVMYKRVYDVSYATMENKRLALSSIFTYLYNHNKIKDNPMSRVEPVKYTKKKKKPLSDEEVERIKIVCEKMKTREASGVRNYAIVNFLLDTGVRVSELCNIDLCDVDFERRNCKVLGKGNKERFVYFTAGCKIRLFEYLKTRTDFSLDNQLSYNLRLPLFVSLDCNCHRLSKTGIESLVRDIGIQAGIKRLHPHLFRATFATRLGRKGVSPAIIARLLGHSNLNTVTTYMILDEDDIQKVIE